MGTNADSFNGAIVLWLSAYILLPLMSCLLVFLAIRHRKNRPLAAFLATFLASLALLAWLTFSWTGMPLEAIWPVYLGWAAVFIAGIILMARQFSSKPQALLPKFGKHLLRYAWFYLSIASVGVGTLVGEILNASDPYGAHEGMEGLRLLPIHPVTFFALVLLILARFEKNKRFAIAAILLACSLLAYTAYDLVTAKPSE